MPYGKVLSYVALHRMVEEVCHMHGVVNVFISMKMSENKAMKMSENKEQTKSREHKTMTLETLFLTFLTQLQLAVNYNPRKEFSVLLAREKEDYYRVHFFDNRDYPIGSPSLFPKIEPTLLRELEARNGYVDVRLPSCNPNRCHYFSFVVTSTSWAEGNLIGWTVLLTRHSNGV